MTVASLLATLSVTNAGDVNFAAVLSLGLAFWMRPNEWFFLDVECLAFVKMQGLELLHILFVISKADEFSSGVVRRTAHRLGCGGTSTAPEIVLDGDAHFHGAFMCPVCYLAYHLRFNELATGPAFRARSDPSAPMPMTRSDPYPNVSWSRREQTRIELFLCGIPMFGRATYMYN